MDEIISSVAQQLSDGQLTLDTALKKALSLCQQKNVKRFWKI